MRSVIKYIPAILSLFVILYSFPACNDGDKNADKAAEPTPVKPITEKKTAPPPILTISMDVIAPDSVRRNFRNLVSVANCESPLGKYTTQVNSDFDGYMYFKQTFSYKPETFEAVLLKDAAWYSMGDSTKPL